jgi:hypothetical protein
MVGVIVVALDVLVVVIAMGGFVDSRRTCEG